MIRYYILPIDKRPTGHRGPKYLKWRFNPDGIDCQWSLKDYGLIDAALIAADVTQAQHEVLAAESDVAALPQDIDQNDSAIALPKVQNVLEALRIPAAWVTTDYTYRVLLRMVAGLFMFAQRYHAMHDEDLIDNLRAGEGSAVDTFDGLRPSKHQPIEPGAEVGLQHLGVVEVQGLIHPGEEPAHRRVSLPLLHGEQLI